MNKSNKEYNVLENKMLEEYKTCFVTNLPLNKLDKDPLNNEVYTDDDVKSLAQDMEENGFLGVIAAYPHKNGRYLIEAGHRRYEAAIEAGFEDIPVYVTSPPEDDIERRFRLIRWNLHGRIYSPMVMAKEALFLFDTYEMDNKRRESIGLKPKPILERVAADLDSSVSNVTKYKRLLNLIPELQSLTNTYSWASLSKAASLATKQQEYLYKRIISREKLYGSNSITGKWIEEEINEFQHIILYESNSGSFDPNDTSMYSKELKDKLLDTKPSKSRRRDGTKRVVKCAQLLKEAFEEDALIKPIEKKKVLLTLRDMQEFLANKIAELEKEK